MLVKNYLREAETFEQCQINEIKAQQNLLKKFLTFSMGMNVFLVSTLIVVMPLKELEPYVIQVDKSTGNQSVITSLTHQEYTPSEAEDKFNISRYIMAREAYVFDTLQRDFDLVSLLSSRQVFNEYKKANLEDTPRYKIYGENAIIEPKIISLSLRENNDKKNALARVEIIKKDLREKSVESKTVLVTMSYEYDMKGVTAESNRIHNPLGFRVDYYRVEDEV